MYPLTWDHTAAVNHPKLVVFSLSRRKHGKVHTQEVHNYFGCRHPLLNHRLLGQIAIH